jgi:hypothetical protein
MFFKNVYWIICCLIVGTAFVAVGYLMLFDPARYVGLRNWHFRQARYEKRLTVEQCSRADHRIAGLFLLIFGAIILFLELRILLV